MNPRLLLPRRNPSAPRLVERLERRLTSAWQFAANTWYYLGRGHGLLKAIELARDTL